MRRLAILVVQAGLFCGVASACSGDEDEGPSPRRIQPGGATGVSGGGSTSQGGTAGQTSGGTDVGGSAAGGSGGEPALGGAGGVEPALGGAGGFGGDPSLGGAGGSEVGGAAGSGDHGGMPGMGGAGGGMNAGGAGGEPSIGGAGGLAGGAGGAGGAAAPNCLPAGTYTVVNSGSTSYTIMGQANPTLTLCRGNTYVFDVTAIGHPFWIKTARVTGTGSAYGTGTSVNPNGVDNDDVVFVVPNDAPDTLYYQCQNHIGMGGTLEVEG